jgi:hypothetical protein
MIQVVLKNGKYAIYNTKGGSIPPANAVAPVISGTAVVGQTLTAVAGTWAGIPTPTVTGNWQRNGVNISGATGLTYVLTQADAGNTANITYEETATNTAGAVTQDSNVIAQILTARTSAFLTASAISDATIRGGLNTFDIGLIANSLDTKMRAVYPFVGGTSSTHRWNFMDARDLDAAFRLAFSGTITHSANGAQGNGVNGYADSFFIANNNGLSVNNNHLSLYSRTSAASTGTQFYEMGSGSLDATTSLTSMFTRRSNNLAGYDSGFFVNNRSSYTSLDGSGFYVGKVNNDLTSKLFRNGVQVATKVITSQAGLSSFKNYVLGFNEENSNIYYSSKQIAFASMGTGLSDAEASTFYNLIQALQTTLGRQV